MKDAIWAQVLFLPFVPITFFGPRIILDQAIDFAAKTGPLLAFDLLKRRAHTGFGVDPCSRERTGARLGWRHRADNSDEQLAGESVAVVRAGQKIPTAVKTDRPLQAVFFWHMAATSNPSITRTTPPAAIHFTTSIRGRL